VRGREDPVTTRQAALVSTLLLVCGPLACRAGAATLSGTIHYTESRGSVSSAHPLVLLLFDNSFFENDAVGAAVVVSNGGAFTLTAPAAGTYYLAYFFDVTGDGNVTPGDPVAAYDNRPGPPGDPLSLPRSGLALTLGDAALATGVAGTMTYTGAKGPVSSARPLVLLLYTDAGLTNEVDDTSIDTNGARYTLFLTPGTYYAVAFVDLNGNARRDPGEPFQVYDGKGAPPGDAVVASTTSTAINFLFGDENVGAATPTRTATTVPTATPTPTPTASPSCIGDCDGGGSVTVNEIVVMVRIVLGESNLSVCPAADPEHTGTVTVAQIVQAVNRALSSC
jgi:hypothetical protein